MEKMVGKIIKRCRLNCIFFISKIRAGVQGISRCPDAKAMVAHGRLSIRQTLISGYAPARLFLLLRKQVSAVLVLGGSEAVHSLTPSKIPSVFCWGARTRTSINGTKIRCPTIRRHPNIYFINACNL